MTSEDTSASTSWVVNTSITPQTPEGSDSKDTTETDTTMSAEKSTSNLLSSASPHQSKATCTRGNYIYLQKYFCLILYSDVRRKNILP